MLIHGISLSRCRSWSTAYDRSVLLVALTSHSALCLPTNSCTYVEIETILMQVTYPASKLQQAFHAILTGAQRHILLSLLVFRIKFLAGSSEKGQGVIYRD
jgi:hypothetical protein